MKIGNVGVNLEYEEQAPKSNMKINKRWLDRRAPSFSYRRYADMIKDLPEELICIMS